MRATLRDPLLETGDFMAVALSEANSPVAKAGEFCLEDLFGKDLARSLGSMPSMEEPSAGLPERMERI